VQAVCNGCRDVAEALCAGVGQSSPNAYYGDRRDHDDFVNFLCDTLRTIPSEQLCSKDAAGEYCLAVGMETVEYAMEPTVEMLDVSSFRLVQCGFGHA
jgi:hypothetical protein